MLNETIRVVLATKLVVTEKPILSNEVKVVLPLDTSPFSAAGGKSGGKDLEVGFDNLTFITVKHGHKVEDRLIGEL